MWLDRLGNQHPGNTSPQPNSRPISPLPLPRRTSSSRGPYLTSHRPGNSHRASSLSLVSNDSSSSLLASAKRANGSTLKQSTTLEDAPDPEEILGRILGPESSPAASRRKQKDPVSEDDLELDFDFGGLSLRELAEGRAEEDMPVYRSQTIEECTFNHPITPTPHI